MIVQLDSIGSTIDELLFVPKDDEEVLNTAKTYIKT
jgi:hypothetical protein